MKGLFVLGTDTGVGKTLVSLDAIHSSDGLPENHSPEGRSLEYVEHTEQSDRVR